MRRCPKQLLEFLDSKLGVIDPRDQPSDVFNQAARVCRMITAAKDNPYRKLIDAFSESVDNQIKNRWCMAFPQALIAYTELRTGTLSKIYPSPRVIEVWDRTPQSERFHYGQSRSSMLAIWRHRKIEGGHVGIIVESKWGSDALSIEANVKSGHFELDKEMGNVGVWMHDRKKGAAENMDFLGYLGVFDYKGSPL